METEAIHHLWKSPDKRNIELGMQLSKANRLALSTENELVQQMIGDSILAQLPKWEKHLQTNSHLTFEQMKSYLLDDFQNVSGLLDKEEYEVLFQHYNHGKSMLQITESCTAKDSFKVLDFWQKRFTLECSILDLYKIFNQLEQRLRDKVWQENGWNCYEADWYLPNLLEGIDQRMLVELKKRFSNRTYSRDLDCAACKAKKLPSERRCSHKKQVYSHLVLDSDDLICENGVLFNIWDGYLFTDNNLQDLVIEYAYVNKKILWKEVASMPAEMVATEDGKYRHGHISTMDLDLPKDFLLMVVWQKAEKE